MGALRAAVLAGAAGRAAGWAVPRLAARVLPYRYGRLVGSPWVALAGAAALLLLQRSLRAPSRPRQPWGVPW